MDTRTLKQQLRRETRQRRIDLPDRQRRGEQIQQSAGNLPQLRKAEHIMIYVGHRSEVQTGTLISRLLAAGKHVYVPWCDGEELRLFRLESGVELQPGAFGIPEPPPELRRLSGRTGRASDLQAVLVPGIAFDRRGHRLGQGKGYYDRLLSQVSHGCVSIGLAYDIQLVERIPTETHDVALDLIVTESEIVQVSP